MASPVGVGAQTTVTCSAATTSLSWSFRPSVFPSFRSKRHLHPHPRRIPKTPDLRLEGNVVRLRGVARQLPDEEGGGTRQGGLPAEEPAPGLTVIVQRGLVERLAARIGIAPVRVEVAQRV